MTSSRYELSNGVQKGTLHLSCLDEQVALCMADVLNVHLPTDSLISTLQIYFYEMSCCKYVQQ